MRIIFLWFLLCGVCVFSLWAGRYDLGVGEILHILTQKIFGGANGAINNGLNAQVILNLRLPRVVLAIFVGCGLGVAGACFQAIFKNPLATPDILGVTSGASFGAILGLIFGFGELGLVLMALVFGLCALALTLSIATKGGGVVMLVLGGIIVSALFQSFLSLIKYIADPQDVLPAITYWLLGSLQVNGFDGIYLGIVGILLACLVIYLFRWKLNILALDDDEARSMGISLTFYRALFIGACALITALVVSMCGLVGWVGLLIPHIARLLCGGNNFKIIPLSLLLGAIFMVFVDMLSRSLSPDEIPISILCALLGAPFFIYVLKINKGMRL
ncbi:iron ABC transporter permease [Helicobacter sp. 11S02596-1]|uniref:FecCD family ABC transporter permease n=1 Tax=Helicobacter sp. 11S02596-1 TaxID=1476194 RepID=UPI000BA785CB|nr:iron ABC transporter permease [Helicobacter sp. 11S02596-1]PAF42379.1 hypothetical protein BJI48_07150 [Helicobacter sp. 11S02596-1]